MPKKNKQPLPKPKCTLSSWRLSEALETTSLQESCPGVCVPSSQEENEPGPSETGPCSCDEDVSTPVTCCALDPQCEERSTPCPAQALEIPICVSNNQAIEVEAMIDEIRICRGIIRKLALEAMDILHPEKLQQYKQNLQANQRPIANAKESCCKPCAVSEANPIIPASHAKPIDLNRTSDCTNRKCELSDPSKYSGAEGQSTCPLFPIPPTLQKSPAISRKSSGSIAHTACQIKDRRLGPKTVRKKYIDCTCDYTVNKKTIGKKPSNCGCDGGENKKPDCPCDVKPERKTDSKTLILEKIGKMQNGSCTCDETVNKNSLGNIISNCGCDDGEKKQNINCICDNTITQNIENEKRENKTECMRDTNDRVCNDEERGKKNRANSLKDKRKAAVCAMPKCAANTCTCHFPPAYSQYFDCTGHVSGNCHCDKNT